MDETKAKKLVDAHWDYIKGILNVHLVDNDILLIVKHHYKTAMLHGYKHGWNDAEDYDNEACKCCDKFTELKPERIELSESTTYCEPHITKQQTTTSEG